MAITISNVLGGIKNPAIVSGGILIGVGIQKGVNALLNIDAVKNGLGSETTLALKNYVSPLVTTALGVIVSMSSDDDTLKKLATGVAISGPLNVGMQWFWDKNLLSNLNGGMLGFLGGDEDLDTEYYEEEEEEPAPSQPALPAGTGMGAPALRDAPYERQKFVSGMAGVPPLVY